MGDLIACDGLAYRSPACLSFAGCGAGLSLNLERNRYKRSNDADAYERQAVYEKPDTVFARVAERFVIAPRASISSHHQERPDPPLCSAVFASG